MRNPRNWIIVALLAALPLAVLGGALAQQQRSTTVDVRVWQSVASPELFFLSIRSGGGSWAEAGTIPLTLGSLSESGDHRYGDLSVTLSTPAPAPTATPAPTAAPTANPGGGGSGGGSGPGGGEASPTRTLAIESTPEPTATPEPSATPTPEPTATPEPSATPTPDPLAAVRANLLRAENAYASAVTAEANARAAFVRADAAYQAAFASVNKAYRKTIDAAYERYLAAVRDGADSEGPAYSAYLTAVATAATEQEAAVATELAARQAADGAWKARQPGPARGDRGATAGTGRPVGSPPA